MLFPIFAKIKYSTKMKKSISNLFNTLKVVGFSTVLIFGLTTLEGCKKEGCTDALANNYDEKADEDDGTCTYDREQFRGSYSTTNSCVPGASWTMNITDSNTAKNKVVISNLGNLGGSGTGTINGNQVTIDSQNYVDSDGDSWTVSSNAGTLTGATVTITVTYVFAGSTLVCNETWNKQ
jgi:hypothetical protein